jgi:hypothetical protein
MVTTTKQLSRKICTEEYWLPVYTVQGTALHSAATTGDNIYAEAVCLLTFCRLQDCRNRHTLLTLANLCVLATRVLPWYSYICMAAPSPCAGMRAAATTASFSASAACAACSSKKKQGVQRCRNTRVDVQRLCSTHVFNFNMICSGWRTQPADYICKHTCGAGVLLFHFTVKCVGTNMCCSQREPACWHRSGSSRLHCTV